MNAQDELYKNWHEKQQDIELFLNLIKSRSNLFVYGPNGSGKTTFTCDCFKSVFLQMPHIYVDCVEYYSEKLISTYISLYLNNILQKLATSYNIDKKIVKRFSFKPCKNFPQLLDHLQQFSQFFYQAKQADQTIAFDFFFYIVLDNVQNLMAIERTKKIMTKLCVIQSLTIPQCFSIVVVNSTLWNEIDVFKDQQPIFEEHMFTPFIVQPMNEQQVKRVIFEKLKLKYKDDYLEKVFNNLFTLLFNDIKSYSTNINEYEYFFKFLYPYFTAPLKNITSKSELDAKLQMPLADGKFKKFVAEVKSSLFMHLTSKEDIQTEIQLQDDAQFQKKIENQQKEKAVVIGNQILNQECFDYRKINYFDNHKKNINFSFMQSLCLISAYLAGANKESIDGKIFSKQQTRNKKNTIRQGEKPQQTQNMLGKTKKFPIERFFAIIDFLLSIEADGSGEHKTLCKTIDYLSCVNSLVEEGLLKKSQVKKGDGSDELINVGFKCNFDFNFIQEVSEKIDFKLNEYLYTVDNES